MNRNSVLDERGDVVLYLHNGVKNIYRDNVCHGLTINGGGIYRDGNLIARIQPDGRLYRARWMPSGKVAANHDTFYGLVAKVARMLLHPATCCKNGTIR